jgi:hypothetical protein
MTLYPSMSGCESSRQLWAMFPLMREFVKRNRPFKICRGRLRSVKGKNRGKDRKKKLSLIGRRVI